MNPQKTGPAGQDRARSATISLRISAVARLHRQHAGALLHGLGLSAGQELLLMLLWDKEPRTQAELTREMSIEAPTTSKMISRLERAGVIVRNRSEADRRTVLVTLTDAGRALEGPVNAAWRTLEEDTVGDLTAKEQDTLLDLLGRILESLAAKRRT
ncbi:MarR family winged helix-turn-helix transcriptional regulator [Mycobacterium sp. URHB0044]|jgi:DNA-binding MarR family transcriptional regulator|uniref:MarR family winged helix-turn-helix transcriptional regulator n=1 Tax=Mycobacterium sp. URHB0044 TaxID=1380386 RepID=UPI00055F9B7C|nr:MarR family transcriptional regulator [Mycobacterium sp. URHB0044]